MSKVSVGENSAEPSLWHYFLRKLIRPLLANWLHWTPSTWGGQRFICLVLVYILEMSLSSALVCSGCYCKIPQMGCLKKEFITQFWRLEVWDYGTSIVEWGPSFWFIASDCSLCPHVVEEAGELYGISFIKVLILFTRAPSFWLKYYP